MSGGVAADATDHRRRFELTPELRGYLFWGPIALVITVTELLGVGWVQRKLDVTVPWPTISTTVGHLQERWNAVAALVVAIIALIGFTAISYRGRDERTAQGRAKRRDHEAPQRLRFYGWEFGVLMIAVGWFASTLVGDDDKYALGYVIYGAFALYGVVLPSVLVWLFDREANFPTLFFTFFQLRRRFAPAAALLVAGLTVLVFHLALYPWPSITNQPSRYAGLNAADARKRAEAEIARLVGVRRLRYSTQTRGIARGRDAWIVFFSPVGSAGEEFAGCMVTVTSERVDATPECSA
jgi:hypothetical protein